MTCRLLRDITHACEYNPGGIAEILIMDIRDFISYKFADDRLYDACLVEEAKFSGRPRSLGVVSESSFTEQESNGIYTQTLATFVRSLDHQNTEALLRAKTLKNLVFFRTFQDRWFTFGSDNGASLSFEQISGQLGESNGYKVTIVASSVYPLFEMGINPADTQLVGVVGTEDYEVVMSEDQSSSYVVQ